MSDGLRPVLLAANVERATDIVASRVAGGCLLRQRLQRRVDREIDGEADVDLCATHGDPVRTIVIARRRALRFRHCGGLGEIRRTLTGDAAAPAAAAWRRAMAAPSNVRRRPACRGSVRPRGAARAAYAHCRRRCRACRRACIGGRPAHARRPGNKWRPLCSRRHPWPSCRSRRNPECPTTGWRAQRYEPRSRRTAPDASAQSRVQLRCRARPARRAFAHSRARASIRRPRCPRIEPRTETPG